MGTFDKKVDLRNFETRLCWFACFMRKIVNVFHMTLGTIFENAICMILRLMIHYGIHCNPIGIVTGLVGGLGLNRR